MKENYRFSKLLQKLVVNPDKEHLPEFWDLKLLEELHYYLRHMRLL